MHLSPFQTDLLTARVISFIALDRLTEITNQDREELARELALEAVEVIKTLTPKTIREFIKVSKKV